MEKNQVIRKVQKYLKKEIKWQPYDKQLNIGKEYNGEPYVLLDGRDDRDSSIIEHLHFVSSYTAECMFNFNISFISMLVNLSDMSVIKEKSKCICNIPRKSEKEYKKVKCHYCKKYGSCDYWFCNSKEN